MPFFPDTPPAQVQSAAAESLGALVYQVKLPAVPQRTTFFTVISSSGARQPSYENDRGGGSLFHRHLFSQLEYRTSLKAATEKIIGEDIQVDPRLEQVPQISGDPIAIEVLDYRCQQRVTILHLVGQAKSHETQRRFLEDRDRVKRYCDRRDITFMDTDSFDGFRQALAAICQQAIVTPQDTLIIDYSGHAIGAPTSKDPRDKQRAGVLVLAGDKPVREFEHAELVHEARIMREIRSVIRKGLFLEVILIIDGCEAGEFDAYQFMEHDDPKLCTEIDESLLPPLPASPAPVAAAVNTAPH